MFAVPLETKGWVGSLSPAPDWCSYHSLPSRLPVLPNFVPHCRPNNSSPPVSTRITPFPPTPVLRSFPPESLPSARTDSFHSNGLYPSAHCPSNADASIKYSSPSVERTLTALRKYNFVVTPLTEIFNRISTGVSCGSTGRPSHPLTPANPPLGVCEAISDTRRGFSSRNEGVRERA